MVWVSAAPELCHSTLVPSCLSPLRTDLAGEREERGRRGGEEREERGRREGGEGRRGGRGGECSGMHVHAAKVVMHLTLEVVGLVASADGEGALILLVNANHCILHQRGGGRGHGGGDRGQGDGGRGHGGGGRGQGGGGRGQGVGVEGRGGGG